MYSHVYYTYAIVLLNRYNAETEIIQTSTVSKAAKRSMAAQYQSIASTAFFMERSFCT